jgi:polysaccharide deacetylase family protein (PEP-CTERM system associated)
MTGQSNLQSKGSSTTLQRAHILTVAVEDYFHASALNLLVPERHRERMDSHVRKNTELALALLDQFGVKATFFVLAWVAERDPALVRQIAEAGHEVASKGYERKPIESHDEKSFREDVRRSKVILEQALGRRILGYRVPQGHIGARNLWALRVLAEEGFTYDSSIYPRLGSLEGQNWRRFPHVHRDGDLRISEFPLSSMGLPGFWIPTAGGNYFRQLPENLMHMAFAMWHRRYTSPFNLYFNVWELDPELPHIATAGTLSRIRQYRNLERMPEIIAHYLRRYRFTSIADHQHFVQETLDDLPPLSVRITTKARLAPSGDHLQPITIIVPCYDEERALGYLSRALEELADHFSDKYAVHFVIVDDCSKDGTWAGLQSRFGSAEHFKLVRHEKNQGVAAAILTGIKAAETEIVCSMDADCTYDPRQLEKLIAMLGADVAMVTASPYHRDGHVVGVPEWRLCLSRTLSKMYGLVLRHRFATYTACFRAYRRSKVKDIELDNGGFLGVAEMLIKLDLRGYKLVECPATLESRLLGRSKMKTLRTIRDHLGLLANIPKMKSDIHREMAESNAANKTSN